MSHEHEDTKPEKNLHDENEEEKVVETPLTESADVEPGAPEEPPPHP